MAGIKKSVRLLKQEAVYLAGIFLLLVIIFKLILTNESLYSTIRYIWANYWLFFIPGYFLMLYWQDYLDFLSRFIAGFGFAVVINTFLDYYTGIFTPISYNMRIYLFPILIILVSVAAISIQKKAD